jgi:hypothetical protein
MTTACSLGAQQNQGERIARSVQRLRAAGTASGEATWMFGVKDLPPGAISDPQSFFRRFETVRLAFLVDLGRDRAQLAQVGKADAPTAVYDHHVVFVRRTGASGGLTSREWSRLNYVDRRKDHSPGVQAVADNIGKPTAALIPPAHLLELVAGTLKGSVKRVGAETVAGVAVTHYKANLSIDSANRKLHISERELDARRAAMTAVAVKGDLIPAEIWVDGKGVLRKLRLRLTQHPARSATLFFVADFEVRAVGSEQAAPTPTRREYIRVDTPSELVRSLHDCAQCAATAKPAA